MRQSSVVLGAGGLLLASAVMWTVVLARGTFGRDTGEAVALALLGVALPVSGVLVTAVGLVARFYGRQ